MPREPRALAPARTAARLVFSDTDLSEKGQELYSEWEAAAEAVEHKVQEYWSQDWGLICKAFRGTEGALRGLNALRAEEEEAPLTTEDELQDFFRGSEDWELRFFGLFQGFTIRVWSYAPFDGHLAYALARAEDSVATFGTDIH